MTNALTRRQTLQALGASLLPIPLIAAAQAAFPNKPVRIIVPLPASGAADVSVRILTEFLQQPWVRASWWKTDPVVFTKSAFRLSPALQQMATP